MSAPKDAEMPTSRGGRRDEMSARVIAWREAIGRVVRERRAALGVSQERLAERVGCDRQTISRVENRRHSPRVDRWHKIADALDLPLGVLFTLADAELSKDGGPDAQP
jgi:putative transcriptional regulator